MPVLLHAETLLAAGYALLLVAIAAWLEWMGRHSHRRAGRYHSGGFQYHQPSDHWECPEGTRLDRAEIDNQMRVIRYRAPARTCNACAIKANCTDSDQGREIAVSLDPFLSSAMGRFHRGMSLVLVTLAAVILAVELVRYPRGPERWLLIPGVVMASSLALHLLRNLVSAPDRHQNNSFNAN